MSANSSSTSPTTFCAPDPRSSCDVLAASQYLSDKQRSGVVELGAAAKGGKLRTLYVIPPSRSVCDELHIAWEPQVKTRHQGQFSCNDLAMQLPGFAPPPRMRQVVQCHGAASPIGSEHLRTSKMEWTSDVHHVGDLQEILVVVVVPTVAKDAAVAP